MSFIDQTISAPCWVMAEQPFINAAGENCLRFEGRVYSLPVGEMKMVPRGFVNHWLGNPDARDHPTERDLRHRTQELTRVARKWGNEVGAKARFPKIKAWDYDQNELPTIVADPAGKSLVDPGADDIVAAQTQQLQAMQQQMARQMAAMRNMADELGVEIEDVVLPQPTIPLATNAMAPAPPTVIVEAEPFVPAEKPAGAAVKEPDGPAWESPEPATLPEPVVPEPALLPPPALESMPETPDPTSVSPVKKAPSKPRTKPPAPAA